MDDPRWWLGLILFVTWAVALWLVHRGGYERGYKRGWLDATHNWTDHD